MEILSTNALPTETRGRKAKYPWDEWLKHGVEIRLTRGVDFTCSLTTMRQMAYNQASNRNGTINSHFGEDVRGRQTIDLTFRFSQAYLARIDRAEAALDVVEEDEPPPLTEQERLAADWDFEHIHPDDRAQNPYRDTIDTRKPGRLGPA